MNHNILSPLSNQLMSSAVRQLWNPWTGPNAAFCTKGFALAWKATIDGFVSGNQSLDRRMNQSHLGCQNVLEINTIPVSEYKERPRCDDTLKINLIGIPRETTITITWCDQSLPSNALITDLYI